jgi:hypothetical protein
MPAAGERRVWRAASGLRAQGRADRPGARSDERTGHRTGGNPNLCEVHRSAVPRAAPRQVIYGSFSVVTRNPVAFASFA